MNPIKKLLTHPNKYKKLFDIWIEPIEPDDTTNYKIFFRKKNK